MQKIHSGKNIRILKRSYHLKGTYNCNISGSLFTAVNSHRVKNKEENAADMQEYVEYGLIKRKQLKSKADRNQKQQEIKKKGGGAGGGKGKGKNEQR